MYSRTAPLLLCYVNILVKAFGLFIAESFDSMNCVMSLCMSVTQYYFKVRCYGTLTGIKMLYPFPLNWFQITTLPLHNICHSHEPNYRLWLTQ